MASEKSPKEIGEILAGQLDNLSKPGVTLEDIRVSDAMANIVGKIWKQAALEMLYATARKQPLGTLPSLERK